MVKLDRTFNSPTDRLNPELYFYNIPTKMTRHLIYLAVISLSIIAVTPSYSQIGWTLPQIEAKYGKGRFLEPSQTCIVSLPKENFPTLNGSGYKEIIFTLYNGKAVDMYFGTSDSNRFYLPAKKSSGNSKSKEPKKDDYNPLDYLEYDTAKKFALAYIEDNPNPRAIQHETTVQHNESPSDFYGARLAGGTESQEIHEFDYKGWHVKYYCDKYTRGADTPTSVQSSVQQSFEISPASNNPIAKAYYAATKQRQDQQTATAERDQRQREDSAIKRETR